MTLVKLTHANLKQPLYVAKGLIAGFYYSEGHKCTHVVASGGAVFPALETVDAIQKILLGNEALSNGEGATPSTGEIHG